jgi:hypothetical protein
MRDSRCFERVVCADTSTAVTTKKEKNRRITSGPMLSREALCRNEYTTKVID